MYVNSARVLPAITPESITGILPFIVIPAMATGTKCRMAQNAGCSSPAKMRPQTSAKVSVGKNGEAYAGGRTEFRRALDVSHPRLRVTGSAPGSLARVKPGAGAPCFCMLDYFDEYWS